MRQLVGVAALVALCAVGGSAEQAGSPADVAARMTGSWKLNKELSPSLSAPAGRGPDGRRGGGALYAMAAPQRGGGRGGGGAGAGGGGSEPAPLMPEEIAAQAALTILHQVPVEVKIEATATDITFVEPRGQMSFKVDNKTAPMEIPGGTLRVKSRWDRGVLRQEFSSTQRKLLKTWTLDANNRLVLTEKIESLAFNTTESKAVFDRQ